MKNYKIAYKLLDKKIVKKFGFQNAYSFYTQAVENEKSENLVEMGLLIENRDSVQKDENYINLNAEKKGFPEFTNYTKDLKATIDHIFYSSNLQLLQLRKLPTLAEMKREGIKNCPNEVFPSEHLPIGAVFMYDSYQEPEFVISE